jgi:hypothetical protein
VIFPATVPLVIRDPVPVAFDLITKLDPKVTAVPFIVNSASFSIIN